MIASSSRSLSLSLTHSLDFSHARVCDWVIQYLVRFLSKVASHKEQNMMGASNLAIVFGPSMLRPRIESIESSLNCPVINRAVQLIIEHLPTK